MEKLLQFFPEDIIHGSINVWEDGHCWNKKYNVFFVKKYAKMIMSNIRYAVILFTRRGLSNVVNKITILR